MRIEETKQLDYHLIQTVKKASPVEQLNELACLANEHSAPAWDRLFSYLHNQKFIDKLGQWIYPLAPPLPLIESQQIERLKILLDAPYEVRLTNEFDQEIVANFKLGELLQHLNCPEIELVGSGVLWVLGADFFKQFLRDLQVPEELIAEELFQNLHALPQDFDFRFSVPDAEPDKMRIYPQRIFEFLAPKMKQSIGAISKAIKKKSCSKPGSEDIYGMANLPLFFPGPTGAKAFDIDLMFYKDLQRLHLNKRDALRLNIFGAYGDGCELKSDLTHIQEAIVHYLTKTMDTDNPETLNINGFATLIALTIKGVCPIHPMMLKHTHDKQTHKPDYPNLGLELNKSLQTHCKRYTNANAAAAFNAGVLVGAPIWQKIKCHENKIEDRATILNLIRQLSSKEDDNFILLQHILTIFCFLGFPCGSKPLLKDCGLIEVKCPSHDNQVGPSLYTFNFLKGSLEELVKFEDLSLLHLILEDWFVHKSSASLPLPDGCEEVIETLYLHPAQEAKQLAFLLQVKQHMEHPSDAGIEKLLIRFFTLFGQLSPQALGNLGRMLGQNIVMASGSYSKETMLLAAEILSPPRLTTSLSHLLNELATIGDSRITRLNIKFLLESIPGKENIRLIEPLFLSLIKRNQEAAWSSFFECLSVLSADSGFTFALLRKLLESTPSPFPMEYWDENKIRTLFQSWDPGSNREDVIALVLLIKGIDPRASDLLVKCSLEKAEHDTELAKGFYIQKLKEVTQNVERGQPIDPLLADLLELLANPLAEDCFLEVDIAVETMISAMLASPKIHEKAACKLIQAEPFQLIYRENDVECIHHLTKVMKKIPSARNLKEVLLLMNGLSSTQTVDQDYRKGTALFTEFLSESVARRAKFNKADKKQLLETTTAILSNLISSEEWDLATALLELCQNLGLNPALDESNCKALCDYLLQTLQDQSDNKLTQWDQYYRIYYPKLPKAEQEAHLEEAAPAFALAWLKVKRTPKIQAWATKLPSYDPVIQLIASYYLDNDLLKEHSELMATGPGRFFSVQEQEREWLAHAQKLAPVNPTDAAAILLGKKELFSSDETKAEIGALAMCWSKTKKLPHAHLALQLLKTYEIPTGEVWEATLCAIASCGSNTQMTEASAALVANYPEASFETCSTLLRGMIRVKSFDKHWLKFIKEEPLPAEPKLLFDYALEHLKKYKETELSFSDLLAFKEKYLNQLSLVDFFEQIVQAVRHHPQIAVDATRELMRMSKANTAVPIRSSKHWLETLCTTMRKDSDVEALKFCLDEIDKANPTDRLGITDLPVVLSRAIGICLQESRQNNDYRMTPWALEYINNHLLPAKMQTTHLDELYGMIADCIPTLFMLDEPVDAKLALFKKYKDIVEKYLKPAAAKKARKASTVKLPSNKWEILYRLVNGLLDIKPADIETTVAAIGQLSDVLPLLLTSQKDNEERCLETIDKLLYSPVFAQRCNDVSDNQYHLLAQQFYHLTGIAMKVAMDEKMLQNNHVRFIEHKAYNGLLPLAYIPPIPYEMHGEAIANLINKLLQSESLDHLYRAIDIFMHNKTYLYTIPQKGCETVCELIRLLGDNNIPIRMTISILNTILEFVQNSTKRWSFTKFTGLNADNLVESWMKSIVSILHEYTETLLELYDQDYNEDDEEHLHQLVNFTKEIYNILNDHPEQYFDEDEQIVLRKNLFDLIMEEWSFTDGNESLSETLLHMLIHLVEQEHILTIPTFQYAVQSLIKLTEPGEEPEGYLLLHDILNEPKLQTALRRDPKIYYSSLLHFIQLAEQQMLIYEMLDPYKPTIEELLHMPIENSEECLKMHQEAQMAFERFLEAARIHKIE